MPLSPWEEILASKEPFFRSLVVRSLKYAVPTVGAVLAAVIPQNVSTKVALVLLVVVATLGCWLLALLAASSRERQRLESELAAAKNPASLQRETVEVLRFVNGGDPVWQSTLLPILKTALGTEFNPSPHLARLADISYIDQQSLKGGVRYAMTKDGRDFLARNSML